MKKFGTCILLIFATAGNIFAAGAYNPPAPYFVTLGGSVKYNYIQKMSYGVGIGVEKGAFDFGFDFGADLNHHLSFGAYFGASPFFHTAESGHDIRLSILGGTDFEFDYSNIRQYYALQPMGRISFGWRFPFGLELKASADAGYRINLANGKQNCFSFKTGLYVSYSFDLTDRNRKTYISPYDKIYTSEFKSIRGDNPESGGSFSSEDMKFLEKLMEDIGEGGSVSGKFLLEMNREKDKYRQEAEYYKNLASQESVRYVALDSTAFTKGGKTVSTDKNEIINDNKGRATVSVEGNHNFTGIITNYVYDRKSSFDIFLSPRNVTDIRLQDGESLNTVVLGDPTMWTTESFVATEGDKTITHLMFRPANINISTDCVVTTDMRTYYFNLYSTPNSYMTALEFKYPFENGNFNAVENTGFARRFAPDGGRTFSKTDDINKAVSDLVFNYRIEGDAAWKPERVYSDGERTYIQFADSFLTSNIVPVLYLRDGVADSLCTFDVKGITFTIPLILSGHQQFIMFWDNELVTISRDEK